MKDGIGYILVLLGMLLGAWAVVLSKKRTGPSG